MGYKYEGMKPKNQDLVKIWRYSEHYKKIQIVVLYIVILYNFVGRY
jgi:hypothetical protein